MIVLEKVRKRPEIAPYVLANKLYFVSLQDDILVAAVNLEIYELAVKALEEVLDWMSFLVNKRRADAIF